MRSFAGAVVTLAALCCAGPALAQVGTYSGLSFVSVNYEEDGFPSADPQAVAFKLGANLHRNLAVEARAGFGVGEDTVTFQGVPVEVRIDHYFGVYGKAIAPLTDSFSAYGLVGLVAGKVTARGFGYSASSSDTDWSFGLGFDLTMSKSVALSLEWARLFEGTDFKVEAASVGFIFKH